MRALLREVLPGSVSCLATCTGCWHLGLSLSRGPPHPHLPPRSRTDLQLDFVEAVFGCSKDVEVDKLTGCGACEGSGAKSGTTPSQCTQCQGSGQLVQAVRTPLGNFQQVSVCPRCEGQGKVAVPCEKCGGEGRVRETKRIQLKVPSGTWVTPRAGGCRHLIVSKGPPPAAPANCVKFWPDSGRRSSSIQSERVGPPLACRRRQRHTVARAGRGQLWAQVCVAQHCSTHDLAAL